MEEAQADFRLRDEMTPLSVKTTPGTGSLLEKEDFEPRVEAYNSCEDRNGITCKEDSSTCPSNVLLSSKRPSLSIPFSTTPLATLGRAVNYLEDFARSSIRSSVLSKQTNHFKTWKKRRMILRGQCLFYYAISSMGDEKYPRAVIPLLHVQVSTIEFPRFKRQNCFEISLPGYRSVFLMAKNAHDREAWMSCILSASIPLTNDYKEILVQPDQMDLCCHLCALEDCMPHERVFYFRYKIAFCLPRANDRFMSPTNRFEKNEKRLTTLYDLNAYCETYPDVLKDIRLFQELIYLIEKMIFRPFPPFQSLAPCNVFVDDTLTDPMDTEGTYTVKMEYTLEDQSWGLLTACYDILEKTMEQMDHLDKSLRKSIFSETFTSRFIALCKSPNHKERQLVKNGLHRLYYTLTQQRARIRTEIANELYEFLYETGNHYGIAELLEILGSIVNGFACPVKLEHVQMLEKALIPLHGSPAFLSYHQQLMYAMVQYVAKDHKFFRSILRGILQYWPVGNSIKEVIFIVELEELLEHVLEETDFGEYGMKLAYRISKCISSFQFQVADRAISWYNSAVCTRIMNQYEKLGQKTFDVIKHALWSVIESHWNASIRVKAEEAYTTYYKMGYDSDARYEAMLKLQEVREANEETGSRCSIALQQIWNKGEKFSPEVLETSLRSSLSAENVKFEEEDMSESSESDGNSEEMDTTQSQHDDDEMST
ncbi:unnamed protein product [Albugo candida]|nr:unnamed protein product [Albugo candida]|eukprot:CCI44550.1 unnamed protein product [Albugo candida]